MRAALLLIALAIVAYFPALYGGPIWDDTEFIFANPLMQDSLQKIWFSTASNDYWPLSYTWLWTLHRIFGEQLLALSLIHI